MIEFVKSPIFDNWFKKHFPEKKLLICSPYMKQGALDQILKLYRIEERGSELEVQVLIRGVSKEFTVNKSSDISILDSFMGMRDFDVDNVKRIKNLHMKAYLIDDKYLLITSGNLTNSGMFVLSGRENFEGGIATDDQETIMCFKKYFQGIWNQGQRLEEFYEELFKEYTEYISRDYTDKETIKRIRRDTYSFEQKTIFDTKSDNVTVMQYDLNDLPPVGRVGHLDDTLTILKNNPAGLTYIELGHKLREVYDYGDLTNITNNRKFGEEKGKFAVYFGLAVLSRDRNNIFKISNLGSRYMEMSEEDKMKFLKDQIFSKPAIRAIFRRCKETGFELTAYLNELYPGTPSTLSRKKGAVMQLIGHIRDMYPESELSEILDNLH